MSATSLNKFSNILLFKHKYSMSQKNSASNSNNKKPAAPSKNVQIKNDVSKAKFLERSREKFSKYEDADIEDNSNSEDECDIIEYSSTIAKQKYSALDCMNDDYFSDVAISTRSSSPLSQEQKYNLSKENDQETTKKAQKLPYNKLVTNRSYSACDSKYLPDQRPKSKATSPVLLQQHLKNRRQSAPVTLESQSFSKGQIVDQMEKEQERVVLKLIKQIHQLKSENQHLKKELQHHNIQQKPSSVIRKNNSVSSSSSRDSAYGIHHNRSHSSASTMYNPRHNSITSATIRDSVLTDFESLK